MHGGRSTGPRTPEGFARLRAARTSHDNVAAKARALDRWRLTLLRRSRVDAAAQRYQAHLPPAFVARLYCHPPELTAPPKPTGGITAQDRVRRRGDAAALAPWQQAIAAARRACRPRRRARRKSPRTSGNAHGAGPAYEDLMHRFRRRRARRRRPLGETPVHQSAHGPRATPASSPRRCRAGACADWCTGFRQAGGGGALGGAGNWCMRSWDAGPCAGGVADGAGLLATRAAARSARSAVRAAAIACCHGASAAASPRRGRGRGPAPR